MFGGDEIWDMAHAGKKIGGVVGLYKCITWMEGGENVGGLGV